MMYFLSDIYIFSTAGFLSEYTEETLVSYIVKIGKFYKQTNKINCWYMN